VLEIGPGPGVLTRELASAAHFVTTIEYDRSMLPVLQESTAPAGNVRIVRADAVRLLESTPLPTLFQTDLPGDLESIEPRNAWRPSPIAEASVTCVSNLPYAITSPVIAALVTQQAWLRTMVLMIQSEVADRLLAKSGSGSYGAFTVFVSYFTRVERVMDVSRTCFTPPPGVDSAIVKLTPARGGTVPTRDASRLVAVSRALFGQRRKHAANALRALPDGPSREMIAEALESVGIAPTARGEELSLEKIAELADALPPVSAARGRCAECGNS